MQLTSGVKWSSIPLFPRPTTKQNSRNPASCNCSKTNCTTGSTTIPLLDELAKIGSISFGCSLVAGNRRVPKPAAGIMTFRIMWSSLHSFLNKQYIFNELTVSD